MTRKKPVCTHCRKPLGASHLLVNDSDPNGVSGIFCVNTCFEAAWAANKALSCARLFADVETVIGVE